MRWTRLSFFYLMTYLALGGLGLLFAPALALRLLMASGDYQEVPMRFLGALLVALALIVIQIVRHRVEVLYTTTLLVRTLLLATIVWLYVKSRDPLFLTLSGIVALGMVLTGLGLLSDRRGRSAA